MYCRVVGVVRESHVTERERDDDLDALAAALVSSRCSCGESHAVADAGLRGAALDSDAYDYTGQVAWNRDDGTLWDRARRRG